MHICTVIKNTLYIFIVLYILYIVYMCRTNPGSNPLVRQQQHGDYRPTGAEAGSLCKLA